jgi:hypothetical protein
MFAPPTDIMNMVVWLAVRSVLVAYTLISTSWCSENHYKSNNEFYSYSYIIRGLYCILNCNSPYFTLV